MQPLLSNHATCSSPLHILSNRALLPAASACFPQPLIPILLLVLGANLANGPQLANGAHLPALNVAGVIASKLILSPLIGLAVVLSAQKLGLLGVAPDPLAVLVMMVSWSTPTAILVHSLALVHKNGEDEVSALLFYEYLAAALTLPLCSALYLYVLGCCVPQVA
jgi:predicted permease